MSLAAIVGYILLFVNVVCIITVVFFKRSDASTRFAWLLVLVFLPVIGFCLYLMFGHNYVRRKRLDFSEEATKEIRGFVKDQINEVKHLASYKNSDLRYLRLIYLNLINDHAVLTNDNDTTVFTNGSQKFDALLEDIKHAKKYIHMLYFIFHSDRLGQDIIDALAEKASQGVDVKLIYDDVGSISLSSKVFKPIREAGGKVYRYSPLATSILSANYRNHRKLAIIDGKVGYIGGMNVGDEYIHGKGKLVPWRDTHLRIEGSAAYAMELIFLEDYVFAARKHYEYADLKKYFDFEHRGGGKQFVQIVSSSPVRDNLLIAYLKTISSAERYVYIQSPYFVPDKSFMDALRIAAASGVDVRIMIPRIPDKLYVQLASFSFAQDLLKHGVKIYLYDGFIHSKSIVSDDIVSTIGSANADIRSFNLSFEANAFIYNEKFTVSQREQFFKDMEDCAVFDSGFLKNLPFWKKAAMPICRLVSPLL